VTTAKPFARYSAVGARSRTALLPPSYTINWDTTARYPPILGETVAATREETPNKHEHGAPLKPRGLHRVGGDLEPFQDGEDG
jgi:hypothetical protein